MFNPNPPKSSLHNLLSNTFSQEKRSRSTARSQQSDNNASRLKNICFPRNDENNPNQTIDHPGFSIRHDHSRYPPARPRQRNTASSHINKSPNVDKSSSFYFQDQTSFVAYNTSDVSFNMSPLSARHENQEAEHDTSGWFEGEKSDIMNRVRKDLMQTTMTPSKTPLKEISNLHQKSLATRDHVIELAQHFNSEMTRFVSTLTKSMKTICLTKTSERSLQVLLEKYSGYLGGIQDEWDQNLHSEEDFNEITKNLVKTLGNCFAELLNKLSDLLHKLKNFKGADFNPLATKGVLTTLAIILQQDQTLTSHQALLQGLQILTQHTNSLVAMRLAYVFKSKIASQKLHAFTAIKLFIARESIKQSEASNISAGSVLHNLMSRQYLKQLFSSFSHLKTNFISQTLKEEINTQESLKDLLTSILKSAHNEPKFFEAINSFLANLTKCGYCEFLLLDKSQHIAYGYPSQVSTLETIENKPLQNLSKRMYKSRDSSDKETLVTFYDSVPSTTREDEPVKSELSYDNESLLQYVISNKQALESWNLPHISLYNRDVDVPLGIKKHEMKFSKFMYYPICSSKMGEKEVNAVVRLFLTEKEGPLDQSRIDSLQRFSQTMGPLFNTFINLIKRDLNTDRLMGGDIHEEVFKKLISGLVKMMNLSDTTDIFQTFSQLLFSLVYMEGFSIFQWNQDGSLGKLYSSDSHLISEKQHLPAESARQLKTANSLQISILDPSTGDLKGLIEIQRSKYEGVIMKGKKKDSTSEKFHVDSLPSTLTTLISTFGFHVIEKTKTLQDEEAERRALEGQVEEVKSINTLLGNRLNLHELLHEFTGKLQNCSSHTEVVLFFNEILQKSSVQIDLATLCFTNSNNTGYFTYNHLYDEHLETISKRSIVNYTENLVSFSKVDSLLGSLLNSIAQGDQIIRINYEQHTRPEAGVLKLPLEQSERHKALYLDLQDEDILSQFPIKTNEGFSNSNEHQIPSPAQRCPKKMLLLPISDHNGNIVAHIVLGQNSKTKMFEKDEEFFAEKLGEILKDYLSSQQKLSNSLNEILREVEKNQANQSKIKAYRGLVLNQNLQPEYQLYKKHKNLQAFLSFLEATYCQLLKAQTSRVLLYNENSDSLYSYPKIQSSEIKEITHKLASSITGNCVLKNDYLIYPVPAASPYALSINDNAISPLASHRIATWRSKISNVGESSAPKKDLKLKTPFKERLQNLGGFAFHHHEASASGWPSSNRSQLFHTPGRPSNFLSQHPQYNPQVDHVDKIQFTKPIMKQSFGMKHHHQSKTDATSSSDMVTTFLCVPLCDDSKKVIGVLQLFNKSQPGKHFQTKDLIKVNAITEAMLPKLMKLINNPEKLSSKAFSTGLDKMTKTFNNYQTDITRDSFLSIKNIYMNHRKHKTRGLYVYAGLNLVSSIFNSNVKRYFDQVKLFDTITRFEALQMQSSRKERLAGLNNVMEKLAWKNKSSGFNSIKLSSYEDLSMLISSQYTKGGDTFKGKGLLLGGEVSIQAKYFVKTISGVLQNKVFTQKKSIFEDFRQHSNTQKALMLLDSQRSGPKSLKSFLSMLTSYIKRFYSEGFLQCNIALVDTMAEKAFWFNEKSTPEFHIGIKNRKQLKNFEKIVQQRLTHSSDSMSVFETDDSEDFEQISYIAIDLSDSPIFEATFDDPNLIIEVMYKGSDSIEITEHQKDQIQGLFVQGISNLRGTLNAMFNLQKKFSTNTKYKSFMKWMLLCKEQKNNEVIGQTHRAFQLVETQMVTFEQDMKKYQEEIVAYDEKFKTLTADLDNKTEINTELNFKIEQLTVEKKAKTKCLALSMMFTHFSVNTSQQFRLRANFDKWRNMAKTARVTTNIVSKISQINHKHISARYRASLLILTHALQKCSQKVLMSSFKQLVASSVMLFTLQKSAIIPYSLSHNASLQDIREEVRSKTPEAATRKSLNNLKVPYLPLKRDTASMHPVEREFWAEKKKEEDREFNTTLHLELPSKLNISGFSHESNEAGIANNDRLIGTGSSIVARYGRKSSIGSRENLDHDTLSRSPKHLSFIQYRVNLMEKGSGKKKGKKPEMSERTVNFLKEFEANKYLNQRKNKGEALNKSDLASSTRKSKYNRDSANQTFHYNRPTNNSFVTNENLGESFSLKNTEDFFKKSAK